MSILTNVAGVVSAVKRTQTHRIFHHLSFVIIKTSNSAYTVSSTCKEGPYIASEGGAVNTAQKGTRSFAT